MEELFNYIRKTDEGKKLIELINNRKFNIEFGCASLLSIIIGALFYDTKNKVGLVINDGHVQDVVSNELKNHLKTKTRIIPGYKNNRSDVAGFISENESEFLQSTDKLYSNNPGVYVIDQEVLSYSISKPKKINTIEIRGGDKIDFERIIKRLSGWGFERTDVCVSKNCYSIRGGILDISPPNSNNHYRVEFFGDVVDSIRMFDIYSQLSTKKIENFKINEPIKTSSHSSTKNDIIENLDLILYITKNNAFINTTKDKPLMIKSKNIDYTNISKEVVKHRVDHHLKENHKIYLFNPSKRLFYMQSKMTEFQNSIQTGFFWEKLKLLCIPTQSSNIYGNKKHVNKQSKFNLNTFDWGDFLVHEDRGVGKYVGLFIMGPKGDETENIKIEYLNGGSIYVPIDKIDKIHKYQGLNDKEPKLSDLNSASWEKQRNITKRSAENVVDKLIELYKSREKPRGFIYNTKGDLINELEQSFPHQETVDQSTSIKEIFKDMKKNKPMDRLLYGDVGFGKTEVALRAAMIAINSGKVVFFLSPTTVLSDQHFITSKNRLEHLGVNIELLSRFKSKKEQSKILNDLSNNKIDLVIGTHRLLSDDVPVENLGLLIVDEEHKFGVKHKNKIQHLKKHTDILTLTATPIPRTLQQSLVGIRDTSRITTPPLNKLPIKTYIKRFDWGWIKDSIEKETSRGGQVYFLHNDIKNLNKIKESLSDFFPNLNIQIGNGQMHSKDLEKIILEFFEGKIDVLVCTTIIESGLDVTNANLIIIDNAHRFGLSQLYQIRGRVGRSSREGSCYLTIPKRIQLKEDAFKRLKALEYYSFLGSGYDIAMKDLEIRGSGNLFGYEQSGQISKVGLKMYNKILREAVDKSKGLVKTENKKTNIIFSGDAFIDTKYIKSTQERINYYQKLGSCSSIKNVKTIKKEIIDRFGSMGQTTKNIINITKYKIMLTEIGSNKCIINKDGVLIKFDDNRSDFNGLEFVEKINKTLTRGGYIHKISPEKKGISINVVLNKSSAGSIIKCIYKGISQNA